MNTLNEAAARSTLIENLQTAAEKLQKAARVRGKPEPSIELLEDAALQMILAADMLR